MTEVMMRAGNLLMLVCMPFYSTGWPGISHPWPCGRRWEQYGNSSSCRATLGQLLVVMVLSTLSFLSGVIFMSGSKCFR